ncbi:MAG TPA: TonB-dependent receptor plug domain-containing protein [Longimicrobiaceae bacterium]
MRRPPWLPVAAVVAALAPAPLRAQEPVTVSGTVARADGAPATGATVRLPALGVETVAGRQGEYRLVVPGGRVSAGDQVRIEVAGEGLRAESRTLTLTPGARLTQNFRLARETGPAAPPPVSPAAAPAAPSVFGVTRVSGEELRRSGETHLAAALAGRVAGVVPTEWSGEAGAATAVRVRGPRTFAGSWQPLWVVDGQPVSGATFLNGYGIEGAGGGSPLAGAAAVDRAADIPLHDVESVEVLRGPAASLEYGAGGGAAGVVRVTTRRGRPGPMAYAFRSALRTEEAARTVPLQRSFGVGTGGRSTACSVPDCFLAGDFFSWGPRLAPGTPTFDHAGEVYAGGLTLDTSLSASGGSARSTFHASASGVRADGFLAGDGDRYGRQTVRLSATHRPRERLTLGAGFALARTDAAFARGGSTVNGVLLAALRTPPDFDNRDPLTGGGLHRSYRFPDPAPGSELRNRGFDNPFYALYEGENTQEVGRVLGGVTASWTPLRRLRVEWALGADAYRDDRLDGRPQQSSGPQPGGSVIRRRFTERTLDHALSATLDFAPRSWLSGSVAAGQNLREHHLGQHSELGRPLILPEPFTLDNTGIRLTPPDFRETRRLEGYWLQGTAEVAGGLALLAGLRTDALTDAEGAGERGWFPRAGAAWSFARALRLPEALVGSGTVRLAHGRSGSRPALYLLRDLRPPSLLAGLSEASPAAGGTAPSAAETDVRLERVAETEAGLELELLRGRAGLRATRYLADATDVVVGPLPGQAGARIRDEGWEAELALRPYTRGSVAVEVGLVWARNRNRVLGLGDPSLTAVPYPFAAASFAGSVASAEVGRPLGVVRGQDFARCGRGLGRVGAHDVGAACAGQPDGALYLGPDGYPVRDPTERAIADPSPDWTGGATAAVRVGALRLAARVDTRQGGETVNLTRASLYQFGTHRDTGERGRRVTFGFDWMQGPVAGPGAGRSVELGEGWFTGEGGAAGPRAPFVEDASVTRLRELSVAYTLERPWLRRALGLRAVEAAVAGRNLRSWTRYTGADPETSVAGAAFPGRGVDWYGHPLARGGTVTLTLTR